MLTLFEVIDEGSISTQRDYRLYVKNTLSPGPGFEPRIRVLLSNNANHYATRLNIRYVYYTFGKYSQRNGVIIERIENFNRIKNLQIYP